MLLANCATHASLKTVYYDLPLGEPARNERQTIIIVLLSDLHSDIYGEDQTPVLERINEVSPDIIVLSGDIYDNRASPLGTRLLLAGLPPSVPVFYVTGNHEYDCGKVDEIMRELSDFGVTVLSDDHVALTVKRARLVIAGKEDPNKRLADPSYDGASAEGPLREAALPGAYRILVCHRPEIAKLYAPYGFDLLLSGHTHGGQIRLPPLVNGLYAPGQGLFPKYSGGVYGIGGAVLVVSRGLTTRRPFIPRIFNPPELVVLRLVPGPSY
ncbi:MAG: metallophosphoesterase [Spirochaetaceae bacterium]|jgi:predicted MPP superfamily phosphohydrolase|nr:metallophosphoesterase [Spirochaetaceae bacterium]